jgi:hypothetical protein
MEIINAGWWHTPSFAVFWGQHPESITPYFLDFPSHSDLTETRSQHLKVSVLAMSHNITQCHTVLYAWPKILLSAYLAPGRAGKDREKRWRKEGIEARLRVRYWSLQHCLGTLPLSDSGMLGAIPTVPEDISIAFKPPALLRGAAPKRCWFCSWKSFLFFSFLRQPSPR